MLQLQQEVMAECNANPFVYSQYYLNLRSKLIKLDEAKIKHNSWCARQEAFKEFNIQLEFKSIKLSSTRSTKRGIHYAPVHHNLGWRICEVPKQDIYDVNQCGQGVSHLKLFVFRKHFVDDGRLYPTPDLTKVLTFHLVEHYGNVYHPGILEIIDDPLNPIITPNMVINIQAQLLRAYQGGLPLLTEYWRGVQQDVIPILSTSNKLWTGVAQEMMTNRQMISSASATASTSEALVLELCLQRFYKSHPQCCLPEEILRNIKQYIILPSVYIDSIYQGYYRNNNCVVVSWSQNAKVIYPLLRDSSHYLNSC